MKNVDNLGDNNIQWLNGVYPLFYDSGITKESRVSVLYQTPTICQLNVLHIPGKQTFKIVTHIASNWRNVGLLLDFDPTGKTIGIIEAERGKEGVVSCCRAMFQHWLQGHGVKPATWGKLFNILNDSGFPVLASDIEKALRDMKVSVRLLNLDTELRCNPHSLVCLLQTEKIKYGFTMIHSLD